MSIYIEPENTGCTIPLEEFTRLISGIEDNPTIVVNCAFEAFELKDGVTYAHIRPASPASLEWVDDKIDGKDRTQYADIKDARALAVEMKKLEIWIAT